MVYLHQGGICREGNIEKCSKGRGSCPPGMFGGWTCSGCLYNNEQEKIESMQRPKGKNAKVLTMEEAVEFLTKKAIINNITDLYSKPIERGQIISYPGRCGSSLYMRTAIVVQPHIRNDWIGREFPAVRVAGVTTNWKGEQKPYISVIESFGLSTVQDTVPTTMQGSTADLFRKVSMKLKTDPDWVPTSKKILEL
jgi:hypothetical protein